MVYFGFQLSLPDLQLNYLTDFKNVSNTEADSFKLAASTLKSKGHFNLKSIKLIIFSLNTRNLMSKVFSPVIFLVSQN